MGELKDFSEKVKERFSQALKEQGARMTETDSNMKLFIEQRDRFNDVAHRIMVSVVFPRMQELSRHFENSDLTDIQDIDGVYCSCDFSHTPRFPATASLVIAFSPGQNNASLNVHYKLKIIPVLMDYKQADEHSFPLETLRDEEVVEWVEAKLLEFLDAYLKLETHPLYQKDNFVMDPVCGMQIPLAAVADKVEQDGKTVYFCSVACKEDYLKRSSRT